MMPSWRCDAALLTWQCAHQGVGCGCGSSLHKGIELIGAKLAARMLGLAVCACSQAASGQRQDLYARISPYLHPIPSPLLQQPCASPLNIIFLLCGLHAESTDWTSRCCLDAYSSRWCRHLSCKAIANAAAILPFAALMVKLLVCEHGTRVDCSGSNEVVPWEGQGAAASSWPTCAPHSPSAFPPLPPPLCLFV